ncbi:MAG: hypothetical protein IPJ21_05315 [Sterolibacteriaceae bacterium]|nr:hypothetical protein [Sterolibacteriaceae bacterium]MBK9087070.1 hypothetical protein [Sterolibacteriaceae bacterium]
MSRIDKSHLQFGRWLCALFCLALAIGCSQKREAQLAPGSVVLALGDSITAGHGVMPEEAWPALLARRSGWRIINAGVSGDTSGGALQRLAALIAEHAPQLVIVEIGGNDMLRRVADQHEPRGDCRACAAASGTSGAAGDSPAIGIGRSDRASGAGRLLRRARFAPRSHPGRRRGERRVVGCGIATRSAAPESVRTRRLVGKTGEVVSRIGIVALTRCVAVRRTAPGFSVTLCAFRRTRDEA